MSPKFKYRLTASKLKQDAGWQASKEADLAMVSIGRQWQDIKNGNPIKTVKRENTERKEQKNQLFISYSSELSTRRRRKIKTKKYKGRNYFYCNNCYPNKYYTK